MPLPALQKSRRGTIFQFTTILGKIYIMCVDVGKEMKEKGGFILGYMY
jgi:hypothetical protein